jgi:hypothetical protein
MSTRLKIYSKIFFFYLFLTKWYFKIKIYFIKKPKFCIIDIDNTIADTWPTINSNKDEFLRYKNLTAFDKMIHFFKTEMLNKDVYFLFLSARNPIYFYTTKKWLLKHGFNSINLILVPEAEDKLQIIKLIPLNKKVIIYDDLSYNHENGEVKFYYDIINKIKTMENVNYFDYEYLKKHQL